jgi:hypothetical protein
MAERKAFLLRIDAKLWAKLEAMAEAELRSVNAQIEYLLREAVERRSRRSGSGRPGPEVPPGGSSKSSQE